jgi:hypothetical protein
MTNTLFGHLAQRFSSSPENLATEALAYILTSSSAARKTFRQLLSNTGVHLPDEIYYRTQVAGDDNAIPDMIGFSSDNSPVIICEAKFWAGLTDNQPNTYLKRLSQFPHGILLFLGPSRRSVTLWAELLRRCQEENYLPSSYKQVFPEFLAVNVKEGVILALCSWRLVLNALRAALEADGDLNKTADIRQLEGLCDLMDTQAFLPLHSEELTGPLGKRLLQYNELINDVTEYLARIKIASLHGVRATPTYAGYGRYMKVGTFGFMLQVNALWWSTLRETPIWLSVKDAKGTGSWAYSLDAEERLSRLRLEDPPRLFREGDLILVPIFLPISSEREKVLSSILDQMFEIISCLGIAQS